MQSKSQTTTVTALSIGFKRYLYLTAAVCGAAILIVEILGAKMLAPFFGTSHFVWTAQIGVTLVSLATGYYAGGKIADKYPKPALLFTFILIAAVYLCLTVPLCRPVSYECLKFKLAAGSLLASLFLFFIPLMLLAMAAPFIVRLLTASVQIVGQQVGRLSAIGTLGSVMGTLLIGYVMIPHLPNSMTMFLTTISLMLLAAGFYLKWHKNVKSITAVTIVITGGLITGYSGILIESRLEYEGMEELERRNSNFGLMQVLQSTNSFRSQ